MGGGRAHAPVVRGVRRPGTTRRASRRVSAAAAAAAAVVSSGAYGLRAKSPLTLSLSIVQNLPSVPCTPPRNAIGCPQVHQGPTRCALMVMVNSVPG